MIEIEVDTTPSPEPHENGTIDISRSSSFNPFNVPRSGAFDMSRSDIFDRFATTNCGSIDISDSDNDDTPSRGTIEISNSGTLEESSRGSIGTSKSGDGTPSLKLSGQSSMNSLSLSSEVFVFSEEDETVNSINQMVQMVSGFKKKPPTIKEVLESMKYENAEALSKRFMRLANDKLRVLDAPGLNDIDVAVILLYTFGWDKKRFKGGESPYIVLNQSLSIDRSNASLKKTRGFLFLLLQALRKLPRFSPAKHTLYRGIKKHVQTEHDPEFPSRQSYAPGAIKTWWTFTSTSEDLNIIKRFVSSNNSTLFILSGDAWGYDISVFSEFPEEKEILLEPERQIKITKVFRDQNIITVSAEMLKTPLVLSDVIKVSKPVKIKQRTLIKEVPKDLKVENVAWNTVQLSWTSVADDKDKNEFTYQVVSKKAGFFNRNVGNIIGSNESKCVVRYLEELTDYEFRVRCGYRGIWGNWSEKVSATTKTVSWKRCPEDVGKEKKYIVDELHPRIAAKNQEDRSDHCTIIGDTPLFPNMTTLWNVKILKSRNNNGYEIYVGVAPSEIRQNNSANHEKCGWYLDCFDSTLRSGPPYNYRNKVYGPRKEDGEYVRTESTIGVVMDTAKGELSFALNGVNLGVAYERIPLDKPLVPCVLLKEGNDSVELDIFQVKETTLDTLIPIPANVTAQSESTWDSITLRWDPIDWASFFQIEVDGRKFLYASSINKFIKTGFPPETEHKFRVRVVRGTTVGNWSKEVIGKTRKESFELSGWKSCPDDVNMKYSIDGMNPRIALKTGYWRSTVIGNTPFPSNKTSTCRIKVLSSKNNDGHFIYIGVVPSDIDQSEYDNSYKCGWYLNCYRSTLRSGPPHNLNGKEYGPRKERGDCVHNGDSIVITVDTTKGEISFGINNANFGIAYSGVPLDKPLVPCALLGESDISIELLI